MKSKPVIFALFFIGSLTLFGSHIFAQKRIKLGYNVRYSVVFHDLETNTSFSEEIRLKRKFGFSNGFQKKIFWEYTPNLNVDTTIVEKIYALLGESKCTVSTCNSDWKAQNKAYLFEKTGLVENRKTFWIHPPRSKYFRILEFVAFPNENKIDSSYHDTITLGQGWGKFDGEIVTSKFQIKSTASNTLIFAEANSSLGKATSVYKVNGQGFNYMEHLLFNKFKITLTIIEE